MIKKSFLNLISALHIIAKGTTFLQIIKQYLSFLIISILYKQKLQVIKLFIETTPEIHEFY